MRLTRNWFTIEKALHAGLILALTIFPLVKSAFLPNNDLLFTAGSGPMQATGSWVTALAVNLACAILLYLLMSRYFGGAAGAAGASLLALFLVSTPYSRLPTQSFFVLAQVAAAGCLIFGVETRRKILVSAGFLLAVSGMLLHGAAGGASLVGFMVVFLAASPDRWRDKAWQAALPAVFLAASLVAAVLLPRVIPGYALFFTRGSAASSAKLESLAFWFLPIAISSLFFAFRRGIFPGKSRNRTGWLLVWGAWLIASGLLPLFFEFQVDAMLTAVMLPVSAAVGLGLRQVELVSRDHPLDVGIGLVVTAGLCLVFQASLIQVVGQDPAWLSIPLGLLAAGAGFAILQLLRRGSLPWRKSLLLLTSSLILVPGAWGSFAINPLSASGSAAYLVTVPEGMNAAGTVIAIGRPDLRMEDEGAMTVDEIRPLVTAGKLQTIWDASDVLQRNDPGVATWLSSSCKVEAAQVAFAASGSSQMTPAIPIAAGSENLTPEKRLILRYVSEGELSNMVYQCG